MSNKKTPAPWEDFSDIWPTKSKYFTWLRGLFRRGWNKSPVKIKFLQKHRFKIKNPNPKGKKEIWGAKCEQCGEIFPMKEIQVDHKVPAGELNDFSDIEGFVTRLLSCGEDDLQLVDKECHKTISHAERYNMTFDEALKDRERIALFNQKVDVIKKKLKKLGATDDDVRNDKKRREFYERVMSTK